MWHVVTNLFVLSYEDFFLKLMFLAFAKTIHGNCGMVLLLLTLVDTYFLFSMVVNDFMFCAYVNDYFGFWKLFNE